MTTAPKLDAVKLSPSSIEEWKESPKLAWLAARGLAPKKPRGIFPSLPGGMDRELKKAADLYRSGGGNVPGLPGIMRDLGMTLHPDEALLKSVRFARQANEVRLGERIRMSWAVDELLLHPESGRVAVFDWKTRTNAPKEEDVVRYYGDRAHLYAAGLKFGLGLDVHPVAIYATAFPVRCQELDEGCLSVEFGVVPTMLEADPERGLELLHRAGESILGPWPAFEPDDEFEAWAVRYVAGRQAQGTE